MSVQGVDVRSRPRPRAFAATIAIAGAIAGLPPIACRAPSSATAFPEPGDATDAARTDDVVPAPADPEHPLDLVPATAAGFVVAPNLGRLVDRLGLVRARAEHPAMFDDWQRNVALPLGVDPLDPSAAAQLGVDASGPAAIALLDVTAEAFMFVGALADEAAFAAVIERLAPHATRVDRGAAKTWSLDPRTTIVTRAGLFAIVTIGRARDDAPRIAEAPLTLDANASVWRADGLARARAPLPTDADVIAFVDPLKIAQQLLRDAHRRRLRTDADAARRLDEARARGATPDEIRRLQDDVVDRRRRAGEETTRAARVERVVQHTLGSIEGIAFAVDATDDGLLGSLHVALRDDAVWRDLVRTEAALAPALLTLGERPVFALSAALDVDALVGLIDELLQVDGQSLNVLQAEIERDTGFDVVGMLRPVLDGHAAMAVTFPPAPAAFPDDLRGLVGGVLAIGVSDPSRASGMIDTAAALARMSGKGRRLADGAHRLDLPDAPPLFFDVVKNAIVVTTEHDQLGRIRADRPGSGVAALRPAAAGEMLMRSGAALRMALHHGTFAALVFSIGRSFRGRDFERLPLDVIAGEFPDRDVSRVRLSAKSRELTRRWERLRKRRDEASARHREAEFRIAFAGFERLGVTVGHVREAPSGLIAQGGHFVTGGIPEYVDAIFDLIELATTQSPEQRAVDDAEAELEAVRSRLLESLRTDLQGATAGSRRTD